MRKTKGCPLLPKLKLNGSIVPGGSKLRWNPIPGAERYAIEWLDKKHRWVTLWSLEGDDMAAKEDGFIEYVDECPESRAPGGTYRITAHLGGRREDKNVSSLPVALRPKKPSRSTIAELARRVKRKKCSAEVKALILRLKWGPRGWAMLLPKKLAQCLDKSIEVEVESKELTNELLDLLAVIFENLPKLASRSEKSFDEYGGHAVFDDEIRIERPCIFIDGSLQESKPVGRWTFVIQMKDDDYAWHIEFVGSRFKRIWAGD